MNPHPLSGSTLSKMTAFVTAHLGLHFPDGRTRDLERAIALLSDQLDFPTPEACAGWILSKPTTEKKLAALTHSLTIGETYFLREPKSFAALEERILPELIAARRGTGQRLRFWSAACCTGEEPYSIAMTLRRALPDLADWDVTILGTDLNAQFLQKAAEAVYGQWSFRQSPPWVKQQYFCKTCHGRFELRSDVKRLVTFRQLNLVSDAYPSILNNTSAMDVIFCRNVLMYFAPEMAKQVIAQLYSCLVDGGWLIVSPTETSQALFSQFKAVNISGAVLYQKQKPKQRKLSSPSRPSMLRPEPIIRANEPVPQPSSQAVASTLSTEASHHEPSYEKAAQLYSRGQYRSATAECSHLLAQDPGNPQALALMARICANEGSLEDAARWASKAAVADKLNPHICYLWATILDELGDCSGAAATLRRVLYLDAKFVLAYFALGNLALRQGKPREAKRHFANALALLRDHKKDALLPDSGGMTAASLIEIIESGTTIQLQHES